MVRPFSVKPPPCPCSDLVRIHRQVPGVVARAGVDVDDEPAADGVPALASVLNGLCDRPSPAPPLLFTYQTMFDRLIVTVPVLVTPLPSVNV